ncbi:serine hydrolase [Sandaracinobacter neustonicus]|uniref:D-alanyl-D-alanine dipeptidase n=1 Tax=Sandaracinobacter neustonicus TaxID=1715348 RepID=A0A501XJW0_9SPHN|nr:serine hydrolase [Sandaracinobacter neustonicus]TPE60554.1 serine hydrolase [Sandaracinobacter neustonicus]
MRGLCVALLLGGGAAPALAGAEPPAAAVAPAALAQAIASIDAAARAELQDKQVPSIAIAIVDRNGPLWAGAWGAADAAGKLPASADTLYRAGSVSKLFTDLAVMRLVEQGKLDLDAPVTTYLPDFRPANPYGVPITLRHLMTHRSGLVREAPRGHYFDDAAKGQADAVASLNETALVAKPGTVTKYSNAGIAVVGEVVARVTGKPFEQAVQTLVLEPLGMRASGFSRAALAGPVAYSQMASFDGGRWEAPPLELGTPAAGSLYTSANDLARLATALLNKGALPKGRLLNEATLQEMWREQYEPAGGRRFGLGFALGDIEGQRTLGHGGAVYGHVTDFRVMPDSGLGVVVLATVDSSPVARRLGNHALATLLAAQQGKPVPAWQRSVAIAPVEAARLAGRYVDGTDSVNLRPFEGGLVLDSPERAAEVRRLGAAYVLDDAQLYAEALSFAPDGTSLSLNGRTFTRVANPPRPAPPAPELAALIGEYGWDYNVLRIYERDGKPYVRIEWTDWLPLTRLGADHYAFPTDRGLYPLESLRFERGADGQVTAAMLGAIRFPRRDFGAEAEAVIRAAMETGIDAARASALKGTPPVEKPSAKPSQLTAITSIDPSIRLDVRYAGTNNFMGQQIYEQSGAFLQKPAAEALGRVQKKLNAQGFGLLIHDAYRPWYVTKMFWDATPPANRMFVADPSKGSRHNRGAAVDLTMLDLKTGKPMITTGRYDEFSSRSYSNFGGGSDEQRWLREVLRTAMESEGYTVYPQEWWHFDLVGWQDYPIGNIRFSEIR